MKDLPLRQLRAFAALRKSGGIRPAARLLGIAHSAVSRHIRELEAWIEVPLVTEHSGTAGLALTVQGEALGRVLSRNFDEMSQAIAALKEARRGNSVTIATTASLASRWLLPRLARLQAVAPWVELSVTVEEKVREPEEAGADLSLRMGTGPWPEFDCEALMDETLFPVMSRSRWEKDGSPSQSEYLGKLPLLHDRDPNTSWLQWRAAFGPPNLDVRSGPRFTSSDLVLRAAAQGLGIALARGRLAEDDLSTSLLVRPFGPAAIHLPRAYWIVRPRLQPERSALKAVLEWLRQEAKATGGALPQDPTGA